MRISDWSSDVCSSDLIHIVSGLLLPIWKRLPNESTRVYRLQTDTGERIVGRRVSPAWVAGATATGGRDRKSVVSGKRVSVRVDLGGRRFITKKNKTASRQIRQTKNQIRIK